MEYTLESLEVYQLAEQFSDEIWDLAGSWKHFEKTTIGNQLVRAADSISANIAEGYGRYFYAESKFIANSPKHNKSKNTKPSINQLPN